MRIQRTLGRFPSGTLWSCLVRMYLCGYVACSARPPAQHCWMCCANEGKIVGPRFDDCETIEMLALKFDQFQTSSNNFQQVARTCNNTHTFGVQTLATSWAQQCCAWLANNVASVCTDLQNSRQGWNASIVFMGVMLLSTCYNKHLCVQISVCLLCFWSPLVLWNVHLVTLRWGKGKRRVRKLFDSGSTKLDKRYQHI